jgi:uncharacterized membrane protein YhaH (DUF805 family)
MNLISLDGGVILAGILLLAAIVTGLARMRKRLDIGLSVLLAGVSLILMLISNNVVVLECTSMLTAAFTLWAGILVLQDFANRREE